MSNNTKREIPDIQGTIAELNKLGMVEVITNVPIEDLETYLNMLTILQLKQIIKDSSIKSKNVVFM